MDTPNIEDLKAKYGRIYTVTIPLDEDDSTKVATYYLRKPDRSARKLIQKIASGDIPERAVITGFNALRVAGDEVTILEQEKNYDAFLAAEDALLDILKVQKATIKKN